MAALIVLASVAASATASNAVLSGPARISVLTESLFRLEWDAERRFVDEPSLIFESASSQLPAVEFTVARPNSSAVVITTRRAELRFSLAPGANASSFSADNLGATFELNATHRGSWAPGAQATDNLGSTTSSMDCCEPPAPRVRAPAALSSLIAYWQTTSRRTAPRRRGRASRPTA